MNEYYLFLLTLAAIMATGIVLHYVNKAERSALKWTVDHSQKRIEYIENRFGLKRTPRAPIPGYRGQVVDASGLKELTEDYFYWFVMGNYEMAKLSLIGIHARSETLLEMVNVKDKQQKASFKANQSIDL